MTGRLALRLSLFLVGAGAFLWLVPLHRIPYSPFWAAVALLLFLVVTVEVIARDARSS